MLESFEIRNFKSFARARLQLRPLTVLIGANASGKTNLLEGLQLLSWMAEGRQLGQLLSAIRDQELSLRGTLPELTWDESLLQVSFACGVRLTEPPLDGQLLTLELCLALDEPLGPRVHAEKLEIHDDSRTGVTLYDAIPGAQRHALSVANGKLGHATHDAAISASTLQPVFTQLSADPKFRSPRSIFDAPVPFDASVPEACRELGEELREILVLDPVARQMRGYSHELERNLRSDGANVSAVLYQLCKQGKADQVLEFVRALPEQDITEVGFIETPRREVMVQLRESFGGRSRWREAAVLSDGTLRALAIAAAVLSVHPGSTVVIEEVDNGVHPSRVGQILERIRVEAEVRALRILVTTHNSAMLDAIPDPELGHVVACYRDPQHGDSRLVTLGELDRFPELIARGPLGQVVSHGLLERFLKQTPEQRRTAVGDWLRDLRDNTP